MSTDIIIILQLSQIHRTELDGNITDWYYKFIIGIAV